MTDPQHSLTPPPRPALRELRHGLANVAWVVFGMVDILTEMDPQRRSRPAGDPLSQLETDASALKRALAPLFDSDLDDFGVPELSALVQNVRVIAASLESESQKLQTTTLYDPMIRRSVAAVQTASMELRQQLAELVQKYPAVG
ncbi:MAG: hypothetical protein EXR69_12925 [Myxococcales bacterium]|nr:hypothetical protein [Myxococcales bacterium]